MTDCAAFLLRKHGARALWFSGGVWQNTTGQPERLLSVEGTQKRLQPSSFPSFCSLIIFWKMKKGWVQFKLTIEKCTKNGEYYDLNTLRAGLHSLTWPSLIGLWGRWGCTPVAHQVVCTGQTDPHHTHTHTHTHSVFQMATWSTRGVH